MNQTHEPGNRDPGEDRTPGQGPDKNPGQLPGRDPEQVPHPSDIPSGHPHDPERPDPGRQDDDGSEPHIRG